MLLPTYSTLRMGLTSPERMIRLSRWLSVLEMGWKVEAFQAQLWLTFSHSVGRIKRALKIKLLIASSPSSSALGKIHTFSEDGT